MSTRNVWPMPRWRLLWSVLVFAGGMTAAAPGLFSGANAQAAVSGVGSGESAKQESSSDGLDPATVDDVDYELLLGRLLASSKKPTIPVGSGGSHPARRFSGGVRFPLGRSRSWDHRGSAHEAGQISWPARFPADPRKTASQHQRDCGRHVGWKRDGQWPLRGSGESCRSHRCCRAREGASRSRDGRLQLRQCQR